VIGGLQQPDAIIEALRVAEPADVRSEDQLLKPRLTLEQRQLIDLIN
jgi:hypothetical protein